MGLQISSNFFGVLAFKTVLKFDDLSIYCQQQKCSAGTLVNGDISFMGYSLGLREEEASSNYRAVFTALTHAVH